MSIKEELLNFIQTKYLNKLTNKNFQKEEQLSETELKNYENVITSLSIVSFIGGLGIAFLIHKRRTSKLPATIPALKTSVKSSLAKDFSRDPMKEARHFALRTFGLGTLLCTTIFGTSAIVLSYATGANNLKEFSKWMELKMKTWNNRKGIEDIDLYKENADDAVKELENWIENESKQEISK